MTNNTYVNRYYPEIMAAGNLSAALEGVITREGVSLSVVPGEDRVRSEGRSSQLTVSVEQRSFFCDFWDYGVELGSGWFDSIEMIVRALEAFHVERASSVTMAHRFPEFGATAQAAAYEAGVLVEYAWQQLLSEPVARRNSGLRLDLALLIHAAASRSELRQLLPYTGHLRLCFSRTMGYPYTTDCPIIMPVGQGLFKIFLATHPGAVLGVGTLHEALDVAVRNLPSGCGRAVIGTGEEL